MRADTTVPIASVRLWPAASETAQSIMHPCARFMTTLCDGDSSRMRELETKPECRFCCAPLDLTVVDLGMSPLSESFLRPAQIRRMERFYPLHVLACERCFLVQIEAFVAPEEIFVEYPYFSSFSTTWVEHARTYVDMIRRRLDLDSDDLVVELASNDGYLLQHFLGTGVPILGLDPAANVAKAAEERGVNTMVTFFGRDTALNLSADGKRASLIIGNNVLAQVPDLNDFLSGVKLLLRDDGTVTLEFPHLLRLFEGLQWDTIYHEHFSYFSFSMVRAILNRHGMAVYDVEELSTHGGSLRVYAQHVDGPWKITSEVERLVRREDEYGLSSRDRYISFSEGVKSSKRSLLELLIRLQHEGKHVVGYGAPGKGNTLLNYCGIRRDLLEYTVDRNPYKHGLFTPGTHIPIYSTDRIAETRPDYVLILPWNLVDEISSQLLCRRLGRTTDHTDSARRCSRPGWSRTRPTRGWSVGSVKVVIFCGGLGVRMGEATQRIPKPMIHVGTQPILWHIMKWYASWGHSDFILCLGYRAEVVKEYFLNYNEALTNDFVLTDGGRSVELLGADISNWRITFLDTGVQATIGERLKAAEPYLANDDLFLANYGDGLTDAPLNDMVDTLVASGKTGLIMSVRTPIAYHRVQADTEGVVRSVTPLETADLLINGGYFVFRRDIFAELNPGEELVDEPFQRLVSRGELIAFQHDGFWAPMDTVKDKQVLDALYETGRAPWNATHPTS